MSQSKPSDTAAGDGAATLGKFGGSSNSQIKSPHVTQEFTPTYIPKRTKNVSTQNLYLMTAVNNPLLCIWRLLKEEILKKFSSQKVF